MGALLSHVQASGVSREAATALIGLLVGWYISRPSAAEPRSRSRRAVDAIKRKEGEDASGDFHFAIPDTLDIRRQAQLVRVANASRPRAAMGCTP
jgi:hypothetical protein